MMNRFLVFDETLPLSAQLLPINQFLLRLASFLRSVKYKIAIRQFAIVVASNTSCHSGLKGLSYMTYPRT